MVFLGNGEPKTYTLWPYSESKGWMDKIIKQVNKHGWNKAFVKVLRANGYSGSNDESIINRYLKSLSESLAAEISSEKYDV